MADVGVPAAAAATFRAAAVRVRQALCLEGDDDGPNEIPTRSASAAPTSEEAAEAAAAAHADTLASLVAAHASEVNSLRAVVDGQRRAASTQQERHGGLAPLAAAAAAAAHSGSSSSGLGPAGSAPKVQFDVPAAAGVAFVPYPAPPTLDGPSGGGHVRASSGGADRVRFRQNVRIAEAEVGAQCTVL